MADAVVLDTSACFAFLEDEAGADVVEKYLLEARAGRLTVHASFATLTEVEYITTQERNTADAANALAKMKGWPVQWQHTDRSSVQRGGEGESGTQGFVRGCVCGGDRQTAGRGTRP